MIHLGLVSVSFRSFSVEKIIELVAENGLQSIEWGADIHVPAGNVSVAQKVAVQMKAAGLTTAAYGSYYKLGATNPEEFNRILENAVVLGAPCIRVWAGDRSSADSDSAHFQACVIDALRIADLAAKKGIKIVYEYHSGTLTDSVESALNLLNATKHPHIRTLWQPINEASEALNRESLQSVLPYLWNLHVFHWQGIPEEEGYERKLLAEGEKLWIERLKIAIPSLQGQTILLEFFKDDSVDNFVKDINVLKKIVR